MTGTFRFTQIAVAALIATAWFAPANIALAQTNVQVPPVQGYPVQEAERPRQPTTRPPRGGVTGLGDTQGVIVEPRFIAEAISFTAIGGPPRQAPFPNTLPLSRPVFAVFETEDYRLVTRTYSRVMTGDTRPFPSAQNCIWGAIDPDGQENGVWSCDPRGRAGPVRFELMLWHERPNWGAVVGGGAEFCVNTTPGDLGGCYLDHHGSLFRHTFSYSVSDVLSRLDPACRCFIETARQGDFQISFRVTRVDDGAEPPAVDRGSTASNPIVHRSGALSAQLSQGFDFDAGILAPAAGADFVFSRGGGAFFLTGGNGAKIWIGGASPRGYATCFAQRLSANYVTGQVALPAAGSYACYVTSDGRVGELQIVSVTGAPVGPAALVIQFTTWQ
jgi:hypothetical protein